MSHGERGKVHDQIAGEEAAARLVRGLLVEPAFDHHVEPREAEPGQNAHHRPHKGIGRQRMDEGCGGGQAAKGREASDMACPAHDIRRRDAAEQEAREIDGTDDADGRRREPIDAGTNRYECAEHSVADEQDRGGEQQRKDRRDRAGQGKFRRSWRGAARPQFAVLAWECNGRIGPFLHFQLQSAGASDRSFAAHA